MPLPEAGGAFRTTIALGEIDGDGIEDLVIGRHGTFALRRGIARGPQRQFAAEQPVAVTIECSCENVGQPQLVDVDRDGDLDLLTLDTPMSLRARAVWCANDGKGAFAAAQALSTAGQALALTSRTNSIHLVDWNGDGQLDLLVSALEVVVHLGNGRGFAATSLPVSGRAHAVLAADWNGDRGFDLLAFEGDAIVLRTRTNDRFDAPQRLATVRAGDGETRLAAADWDGDGKLDLLLSETIRQQQPVLAPDVAADYQERQRVAERELAVVIAEFKELNASRPPIGDAAAMAKRAQRREQLEARAKGPQATLEDLRVKRSQPGTVLSSTRALLRR